MIVLDTSVLSAAFLKKRPAAAEVEATERLRAWILRDVPLAIPGIVYQEILTAPRSTRGLKALHEAVRGFPLLLAGSGDLETAAGIRRACADARIAASTVDALIAAQAMSRGRRLYTLDEDFRSIARVVPLRLA